MQKAYILSTCDTCKRILKEINLPEEFEIQDIKKEAITPDQLEEMKKLSGNYESLFNRRAQLYRQRNLKDQNLSESDYKDLILEHYTFLKRPVFVKGEQIFIGNSKKVVQELKDSLFPNS